MHLKLPRNEALALAYALTLAANNGVTDPEVDLGQWAENLYEDIKLRDTTVRVELDSPPSIPAAIRALEFVQKYEPTSQDEAILSYGNLDKTRREIADKGFSATQDAVMKGLTERGYKADWAGDTDYSFIEFEIPNTERYYGVVILSLNDDGLTDPSHPGCEWSIDIKEKGGDVEADKGTGVPPWGDPVAVINHAIALAASFVGKPSLIWRCDQCKEEGQIDQTGNPYRDGYECYKAHESARPGCGNLNLIIGDGAAVPA